MPAIRYRTLSTAALPVYDATGVATVPTTETRIPRDTFIRSILITVDGCVSISNTPAPSDMSPMALISGIRLVANGNNTLVNTPAAQMFYLNAYEYECELDRQNLPLGAANNQNINFAVALDFNLFPQVKGDFSCLHPAHLDSSLNLYLDWNTFLLGLGTNVLLGWFTAHITLEEVILNDTEVSQYYGGKLEKLLEVRYSTLRKVVDAAYANYNFEIDMPTGNILQKTLIQEVNNSLRADWVTAFKITKESPAPFDVQQFDWRESKVQDMRDYHISVLETNDESTAETQPFIGTTIFDPQQGWFANVLGYPVPGIDLRGMKSGDLKYRHVNVAPTGTSWVFMLQKEANTYRR